MPEDAEVRLRVGDRRIDRCDLIGVEGRVVGPLPLARHEVARVVCVALALDHFANDPPLSVSPTSHGSAYDSASRIRPRMYGSTEESRPDEEFAGSGRRYVRLAQFEAVHVGLARRSLGEQPLAVGVRHG